MTRPDLQDTDIDSHAMPPSRSRPALAVLTTAAVTVVSIPVQLFLAFMFLIAAGRYDTSGRGGPLKNCDNPAECSDPIYLWMLGAAGLMILLWLVAAQIGQLVWGRQPRLKRMLALVTVAASPTIAAVVGCLAYCAAHTLL